MEEVRPPVGLPQTIVGKQHVLSLPNIVRRHLVTERMRRLIENNIDHRDQLREFNKLLI